MAVVLHVVGGFDKPAGNVIQRFPVFAAVSKHTLQIGFLFVVLFFTAFIGRVAADIGFSACIGKFDAVGFGGGGEQVV